MEPIKVLLANIDKPNSTSIDVYMQSGGYEDARKALQMKPEDRFASTQEMMVALTPYAGGATASKSPASARDEVGVAGDVATRSVANGSSSRASTTPAAPEAARRPRWRAAAVLTPLLVAAPVLYMTQCNRLERSASDRAVTTTALAVTPTAESGGPP